MLAKKSIKIKENLNNDLYCGHCTCACAKLLQSCPTLCNPMDCDPPRSSVHGILQARILEWVALLLKAKPNLHCSNYRLNPFFVNSPESPRCSCHTTQVPGNGLGSPTSPWCVDAN